MPTFATSASSQAGDTSSLTLFVFFGVIVHFFGLDLTRFETFTVEVLLKLFDDLVVVGFKGLDVFADLFADVYFLHFGLKQ